MSLLHAVANVRKPFANGIAREAYYSKKYNVVIKRDMDRPESYHCHHSHRTGEWDSFTSYSEYDNTCFEQTEKEIAIFQKMTKREKEVFPIITTIFYNGKQNIIMKRCDSLRMKFGYSSWSTDFDAICFRFGLDKGNNNMIRRMMRKYDLDDLHSNNLGVDEKNRLVILDAGL